MNNEPEIPKIVPEHLKEKIDKLYANLETEWVSDARAYMSTVGNLTGFLFAALVGFIAFVGEGFTSAEKVLVLITILALLFQVWLWTHITYRQKAASWKRMESTRFFGMGYVDVAHRVMDDADEFIVRTNTYEKILFGIVYITAELVLGLIALKVIGDLPAAWGEAAFAFLSRLSP